MSLALYGGYTAGDKVVTWYVSANRDPEEQHCGKR